MPQANQTFRVFVSSTFNDLKEERNALQQYVFPRLRELSMRYGCRFQAIDLRWGVREEAALDQQAMRICLEEIKRCQKVTPRPNFIVLLGDRYGWQPVPAEIPADEFNELELYTTEIPDREYLHAWYKLDKNAVEWEGRNVQGVFILQTREGEYKNIDAWDLAENRLRELLHAASAKANFSEEQRHKYSTSATEQEIYDGALSPDLDKPEEHIFCFFREIVNLESIECDLKKSRSDSESPAVNFVDHSIDGKGRCPDAIAKQLLNTLKEKKLTRKLTQNIHYYSTEWKGSRITQGHIGELPATLDECLLLNEIPDPPTNMCTDIWRRLSGVILSEVLELEKVDPLEQEISVHHAFGVDRLQFFTGRAAYFKVIGDYFKRPNRQPLVLFGEPGSGKTSLLAKSVDHISKLHQDAVIALRFIGATPTSSDGRSLLESLCRQISRAYDADETDIPLDYSELVTLFPKKLSFATAQKPLFIFLDALDQLADTDNAGNLVWIPMELPEHVRLIVSTLPGQPHVSLDRITPDTNRILLKPMSSSEGSELLDVWLRDAGRTLQNDQRKMVLSSFEKSGMPLYLKLVFEEAKLWKSYTPLVELSQSISGVIKDLLNRLCLDENHGEVMVSRSLGYLATARNGLTEDELLDVLSVDKDVFHDFTERAMHTPPELRLPAVIWSRLYFDLEPYLMERAADGANLMTFYHNQFAEVVYDEFLQDDEKTKRHKVLAQYFDRQLLWIEKGEEKNPNIRKASELPYQQIHGQMWEELQQTLCNLHFIEAKCAAGMTYDLIADYDNALNILPETQKKAQEESNNDIRLKKYAEDLIAYSMGTTKNLDIIHSHKPWTPEQHRVESLKLTNDPGRSDLFRTFSNFVKSESHAMVKFAGLPGLCAQQAYNAARSGPVAQAAEDIIGNETETPFLLRRPQQRPEFNPNPCSIRTLQQHTSWVTSVCVDLKQGRVVSGGWDQSIRLWEMETGECLFSLEEQLEEINSLDISADGKMLISGGWGRVVQVWDLESRACLFSLEGHTDWINTVSISPDKSIAVSGSRDRSIRIWDLKKGQKIKTLRGHTGSVQSTYIAADRRLLISGSQDHTLGVWDLDSGECRHMLKDHTDGLESVFATPNGKVAISGSRDCTVRIWDLERGECIKVLNGHSESVESVCVTPDGKIGVSGSQDCTVRVWDVERGECIKVLNGHSDGVESVCITADGRIVVSASQDFTLRTWNIATGDDKVMMEKHTAAVESVDLTPDGKKAVSGGRDWIVKVWDVQKGELLETLKGHGNIIKSVCISSCGTRAVSGSWDQTLGIWNLQSSGELLRSIKGNRLDFDHLCLSLDGRNIFDRALHKWDLDSGECLQTFNSQIMQSGAFVVSPDGETVATGCPDNSIRIWELESGKCIRILEGHKGEITSISIAPDIRWAVSGSKDRTMKVWDIQAGKCTGTIEGHSDEITGVSIMPDTMIAVSGGWDRTLRVWNLESCECIAILPTNSEVISLSRIGAGGHFVCGTDDGEVILLTIQISGTHSRVTTPVRCWIYDGNSGYGRWEDSIKAVCFWCGEHLKLPETIFGNTGDLSEAPDFFSELSTCFNLPLKAWDESHLFFNCPECQNPLKSSPFFVDNRNR